jgi:hypothetical protein
MTGEDGQGDRKV